MDLKITPSGQTIVKPTALGPVANTDTELLIYGLFQKGRVLAQDAEERKKWKDEVGRHMCWSGSYDLGDGQAPEGAPVEAKTEA